MSSFATSTTAPAKLLLLGEHTVLHGSKALAVPLARFCAKLVERTVAKSTTLDFEAWANHAAQQPLLTNVLDFKRWRMEASLLAVQSTIPMGCGLGSSGALVALVAKRFGSFEATTISLPKLRSILASLEGYFHGSSSGIDPLVSYLSQNVVVAGASLVRLAPSEVTLPKFAESDGWFLVDSGVARRGKDAIASFSESCKNLEWRTTFLQPMMTTVDKLVDALAPPPAIHEGTKANIPLPLKPYPTPLDAPSSGAQSPDVVALLRELSALQLRALPKLIPASISGNWETWLAADLAYLKLCGAGGGGYFLGYAPQRNAAPLQAAGLIWLN